MCEGGKGSKWILQDGRGSERGLCDTNRDFFLLLDKEVKEINGNPISCDRSLIKGWRGGGTESKAVTLCRRCSITD